MLTCVIVDDELIAITNLKRLLAAFEDIVIVRTFLNPNEFLFYIERNPVDIIFLDIKMPAQSGVNIAKKIASKTTVIFTTSTTKYALESYSLGVADYLLKPILSDRLILALEKAKILVAAKNISPNTTIQTPSTVLSVVADRKVYKINTDDIIYLESQKEYVCYHTNKTKLLSLGALKDCVKQLPKDVFTQIHRSLIINKNYITSYTAISITLANLHTLPIGRLYKNEFKKSVENM